MIQLKSIRRNQKKSYFPLQTIHEYITNDTIKIIGVQLRMFYPYLTFTRFVHRRIFSIKISNNTHANLKKIKKNVIAKKYLVYTKYYCKLKNKKKTFVN